MDSNEDALKSSDEEQGEGSTANKARLVGAGINIKLYLKNITSKKEQPRTSSLWSQG